MSKAKRYKLPRSRLVRITPSRTFLLSTLCGVTNLCSCPNHLSQRQCLRQAQQPHQRLSTHRIQRQVSTAAVPPPILALAHSRIAPAQYQRSRIHRNGIDQPRIQYRQLLSLLKSSLHSFPYTYHRFCYILKADKLTENICHLIPLLAYSCSSVTSSQSIFMWCICLQWVKSKSTSLKGGGVRCGV